MMYNDNSNVYTIEYFGQEPVTLDDVKRRLNMKFDSDGSYEFSDDDVLITDFIVAAREWCERHANIAIKEQTIVCEIVNKCGGVSIPFGPVGNILSAVDLLGAPLSLQYSGDKWRTLLTVTDYCKLTYKSGYAMISPNYAALPKNIKEAIIAVAVKLYSDRGDSMERTYSSTGSEIAYSFSLAKSLLAPFNKKSWLV